MPVPRKTGRLDVRLQIVLIAIILSILLTAAFVNFRSQQSQPSQSTQQPTPSNESWTPPTIVSPNLFLGLPSSATANASNKNDFLMIKPFYVLSYNNSKGTPNWVSWRVVAEDLGTAPRKQTFDPDDSLPPGYSVVTHKDYSNSGFDRGHMCPHSDRDATQEMSYATFVMTNIIPQAPHVNQKAWEQLETYTRDLVHHHNRAYVIAGPYGQGGTGSKGAASTIANGKVTVPAACWKVIVIVPDTGSDDLNQITPKTRVISVDMPNDNTLVGEAWTPFLTSPASIEAKTGLHFFSNLKPEIADALRKKTDAGPVN